MLDMLVIGLSRNVDVDGFPVSSLLGAHGGFWELTLYLTGNALSRLSTTAERRLSGRPASGL